MSVCMWVGELHGLEVFRKRYMSSRNVLLQLTIGVQAALCSGADHFRFFKVNRHLLNFFVG